MKNIRDYFISDPKEYELLRAPRTFYCKLKHEFDQTVGSDFIKYINDATEQNNHFLVGLSHGQSPTGSYQYILDHYSEIKRPELISYTFVSSKQKRQIELVSKYDATSFVQELLQTSRIKKNQIIGEIQNEDDPELYATQLSNTLSVYLKKHKKEGLDYVFISVTPGGQVAGITRQSKAFTRDELVVAVKIREEYIITFTPSFLMKSKQIAFLVTKAEKRRPLAWLFYKWAKPNESPSFLKFISDVEKRMTVYIDAEALTWPQLKIRRPTKYGESIIRIDLVKTYQDKQKTKLPVIVMIHGFLGLNTFDALLTFIPSKKYIAAAMHYGSIPNDLPPKEYSFFVAENINEVVNYFGEKGHPVYILDHSLADIYFLIIDQNYEKLKGIQKYLQGRIACNPFSGEEVKHASLEAIDHVILKSRLTILEEQVIRIAKSILPFQSRHGAREIVILLAEWLINRKYVADDRIWKAIKSRVLHMVTTLDTFPHLNRVPIEHALNKLPVKVFAIQIFSALTESKKFAEQHELINFSKNKIPVLILKSERDPVAKFVSRIYERSPNVEILDITVEEEKDVFKEHLFYMIHPQTIIRILDQFISDCEELKKSTVVNNTMVR